MKIKITKIFIVPIILVFFNQSVSQSNFTPYDQLPGIHKIEKPTFSEEMPDWARMLYDYPVNYFEICRAFEKDIDSKGKNAVIRYFKNWKRAVEPHVQMDGSIKIPDLGEYHNLLYRSQTDKSSADKTELRNGSDWSFVGPVETFWLNQSGDPNPPASCPWQVNVYSFDVFASDPAIIFCGTETGFVNKSLDKGYNWEQCGLGYYFGGAVTAVAVHPLDPELVYVSAGKQVHRSADGGTSWQPLVEPSNNFGANRLKIDHQEPNTLIASSNEGFYVSHDGGTNWQRSLGLRCYDAEYDPVNSQKVYTLARENNLFSFYVSDDHGDSFSKDETFPGNISDASGGMIAVSPANPGQILVIMLSEDKTPFLYKKTPGSAWELLASGKTAQLPLDNGQGYFDLVLECSPVDKNIIFAGTTTLFKSADGGESFQAIGGYSGSFAIHPDIQDMKLLPNGETWVSTDGGFSMTTDNFTDTENYFARNNGLIGSDMWGFGQGWNEDILVGGRYHNGNTAVTEFYHPKALRMGGAEAPTGWVLQGKSRHVAFSDLGNGWILPGTAESAPEGRFIFSKFPNMDEYGGRRSNLVFHPNYYGTILLGADNMLWQSTDMGVSFEMVYDFGERIRYLDISYKNPDIIYADIVNKGLFKSEDGGVSWIHKPSLTSGQYGNSYWNGKLFFVISPRDENTIYACLSNGTWSADIGKVFRSKDGGDTWENWTSGLEEYTKCLVIQPAEDGSDIVYLFSRARNDQGATVHVRKELDAAWTPFNGNYPAGMAVNLALPFYRDGKLRVAGNAGFWESSMLQPNFLPIINPWVEKANYNCMSDTLYFDDHSILNHEGASWHWSINPSPEFIDDPNIRNPRVVLGNPGSYDVTLEVEYYGQKYSRTLENMVSTTTCPSIEDCNNPASVPRDNWQLIYFDSQEINYPGLASMAFDGDPSTIWHTRWSTGSDPYPHELQIALGNNYHISELMLLNRQNGPNGRIRDYELYISEDSLDWGEPVSVGQLENTGAPQYIEFSEPVTGSFLRLLALSEVNGNAWSSIAELELTGCLVDPTTVIKDQLANVRAYPVPVMDVLHISLPVSGLFNWELFAMNGKKIKSGQLKESNAQLSIQTEDLIPGLYIVRIIDQQGSNYWVKVIRGE
jgi:photosystem II stability/assembly factor-like uncharacterized protein